MLYVFHVDAGQMTTYDMSLTLQSVTSLRAAIEKKTKIPASSLVLLVSGGEVLQSDHMVSSYSAGTDTNPIYMFSKPSVKDSTLKQSNQYSVCDLSPIVELSTEQWRSDTRSGLELKSVGELKADVEKCCSLPPSVQTVVTCAGLAQQFSELAHDLSRCCEQLVHDQHLQHQGWAAVVANLEDIFNEFCERSKNFKESFKKHRLKKDLYHDQLSALNEVLESLGKIPILPALRLNAEAHRFSAFDVYEEADFEAHYYKISAPLDQSSENKGYQDFGVEAFKMSEEDVFGNQKQQGSAESKQDVQSTEGQPPIEESDEGVTFKAQSYESNKEDPTLLHWILAQGNKATLQDILDYCQKGLSLIDEEPLKEREAELCNILKYANVHGLKQIKGIEDRLYGLDQLLSEVKKLERDQHDQAASLIQNRERVSTACDPSVLPTLVQSHRCQLEKLLRNHQVLVDIRRRIHKSKDELSHILKARLEAVLTIENSMSVQDAHHLLSFQCFNRLARYFDIVGQLHRAPAIFVRAVHEVARRRAFSHAFLQWATNLATNLLTIHDEEVSRRQEFNVLFHGHFLKSLFPGMAELPPPFATQAPATFDASTPKITSEDVEFVAGSFPELAKDVPKCDMEATVQFFRQRFSAADYQATDVNVQADLDKCAESETETGDFERLSRQSTTDKQRVDTSTSCAPETAVVATVTEVRAALPAIPEVPEGRDEFVDSQFYIEESLPSSLEWGRDEQVLPDVRYETLKMLNADSKNSKDNIDCLCVYQNNDPKIRGTHDPLWLIKDNMDSHKINMAKLRSFLDQLIDLCRLNILFIREELSKLKSDVDDQNKFINGKCVEVLQAIEKCNEENAIRFREETQRLTVDHELELNDLKNDLNSKDAVIDTVKREKEDLKVQHQIEIERLEKEHQNTREILESTRLETKQFEQKLEEAEAQKQKELKDLQDKMHQDYKAEIESMRSRFRLVALTNMDRSPSESSLEKIERTDVIEISSHNAIVMQTKENAEVEKEEAVRVAREACDAEWRRRMDEEARKCEVDKQVTLTEVTRRLLAEKDRQLELLREREAALARDCVKYRETIHQLADPETNDYDSLLKAQLTTLENEKAQLHQQVKDLKKELEKKEEADKNREDDSEGRSSSPKREEGRKGKSRCHTPSGLSAGTLSLSSCLPGHTVLVLWDRVHQNYTVMQEAAIMYFVHSDCLSALDLSVTVKNESDRRLYAIATVESKEYCYAKKSGNRYHMPRGSRFYRVRVRPSRMLTGPPPCCENKHKSQDGMKAGGPPPLCNPRPVKKWLTYMHAPDTQKSVDTSQSTSSNTDETGKVSGEVVTATLINLESPVSTSEAPVVSTSEVDGPVPDEQLDSIETSEWGSGRMMASTVSAMTDMECSVGRVTGPELELPAELTVSAVSVQAREGSNPPADSELAEEATP